MFRKHKKDARSEKCVEADILSQVANEFNLKTEAALKKFLTKHKYSATQVVRNADKKTFSPMHKLRSCCSSLRILNQ